MILTVVVMTLPRQAAKVYTATVTVSETAITITQMTLVK